MQQIGQRDQAEQAVMRTVASNLRRIRKLKGIRQVEVEERCGVAYRHYQDIEAGKVNVTIGTLQKLAYVYGCHMAEFFMD